MAHFLELPVELLPVIFDFVLRPQHISALCLVNKTFNRFATPLLYRRVFIFAWYKAAKTKVGLGPDSEINLFKLLNSALHTGHFTLRDLIQMPSSRPLCREVRRVAVDLSRDFNPSRHLGRDQRLPEGSIR